MITAPSDPLLSPPGLLPAPTAGLPFFPPTPSDGLGARTGDELRANGDGPVLEFCNESTVGTSLARSIRLLLLAPLRTEKTATSRQPSFVLFW